MYTKQHIHYDQPIEVNEKQYNTIMRDMSSWCAGRTEAGKFFIKLWAMKHKQELLDILNGTEPKPWVELFN